MARIQTGKEEILHVNFPKSQAGKSTDVYYTIYNSDGTEFVSRTNSGVIEYGLGKYGIKKTFLINGAYAIYWDIDGLQYNAGEEINVLDFNAVDIYTGYGN